MSKSKEILLPEHEIFDSYYDLKNQSNFNIAQTHQLCLRNIESSAKNIIKYISVNGDILDYFVSNEYGEGRIV